MLQTDYAKREQTLFRDRSGLLPALLLQQEEEDDTDNQAQAAPLVARTVPITPQMPRSMSLLHMFMASWVQM